MTDTRSFKDQLESDLRLIENIQWKSIDRDNMEFEMRTTCYVRDAINRLVKSARQTLEEVAS